MRRSDQENAGGKDFTGLGRDTASCAEPRKHVYGGRHVRRECKHLYNLDPHVSNQHYAHEIAMVKSSILDAVQQRTAARWLYNHHLTNNPANGNLAFTAMVRPAWNNAGGRQQLFSFNRSQEQKEIKRVNDAYQILHARGHDHAVLLNSTALNCNLPANSTPDHSGQGMKAFPFVAPVLHEHPATMRGQQSPTTNARALTPPLLATGGPSTRTLPAGSSIKPSSTQLTIFYGGKVNVYNDVSSSKAKEIMLMAAAGNSLPLNRDMFSGTSIQMATSPEPGSLKNTHHPALFHGDPSSCQLDQLARDQVGIGPLPASMPQTPQAAEGSMPGTQRPNLDDEPTCPRALPLARKASLTRFLERRKERVQSKSPYPVEKPFF